MRSRPILIGLCFVGTTLPSGAASQVDYPVVLGSPDIRSAVEGVLSDGVPPSPLDVSFAAIPGARRIVPPPHAPGTSASSLDRFAPGSSRAEPDEAADGRYFSAWPVFAADVDDDGAPDAVIAEYADVDAGRTIRLSARRGSDGAPLWVSDAIRPEGFFWVAPIDLDGDAAPEIVTADFHYPYASDEACNQSGTFDQVITVRSSADGSERWSRAFESEWTLICRGDRYFLRASGLLTGLHGISPSGNTPGAVLAAVSEGLVFGTRTLPGSDVLSTVFGASVTRIVTTAHILEAASGNDVSSFELEPATWYPLFRPLPPDEEGVRIFSLRGTEATVWRIDGTPVWRAVLDGEDWWPFVWVAPVVSPASHDIVVVGVNVTTYDIPNGWVTYIKPDRLATIDGARGDVLVDRRFDGSVDTGGSLDGDGGLDFVEFSLPFEPTLTAWALSGVSGGRIAEPYSFESPSVAAPDRYSYGSTADLDGDGANDLCPRGFAFDDEGDMVAFRAAAFSIAEDRHLWELSGSTWDDVPFFLWGDGPEGLADVDRDGGADLLTSTEDGTFSVHSGASLTRLFTVHAEDLPGSYEDPAEAMELSAATGLELVASSYVADGRDEVTLLSVLEGPVVSWTLDPRTTFGE